MFTNYAMNVWLYNAVTVCFCVSMSLFLETFCFIFHLEQSSPLSLSLGIRGNSPTASALLLPWKPGLACEVVMVLTVLMNHDSLSFLFLISRQAQNLLRVSGPKKYPDTLATPKSL